MTLGCSAALSITQVLDTTAGTGDKAEARQERCLSSGGVVMAAQEWQTGSEKLTVMSVAERGEGARRAYLRGNRCFL